MGWYVWTGGYLVGKLTATSLVFPGRTIELHPLGHKDKFQAGRKNGFGEALSRAGQSGQDNYAKKGESLDVRYQNLVKGR